MSTSTSNQSSIPLPIFKGENYDFWSIKMRTFFLSQDLWDIVDKGFSTSENPSVEQLRQEKKERQKDATALYAIQLAVDDTNFSRIMGATTSKEAWDLLKEEFQGTAKVRSIKLQTMRRDLENLKMKESEIVKDYYSRLKEIVNQLRAYGENISETRVVEKILISLTEKYDPIVTAIENSKDITSLSVTELIGSLEAFEKRLSGRNESPIEKAFRTKINLRSQKDENERKFDESSRGGDKPKYWVNEKDFKEKRKYPPCGICNKNNHKEEECWFRGKPKCRNCNKFGHKEENCFFKKSHRANFSRENEQEEHLFYTRYDMADEEKNRRWYVDSGCNNHMSSDKNNFSKLKTTRKSQVKLGNGDIVETKGKGTISIPTTKGTKYINDVLLVPSLEHNLLSVGQMMENGYAILFEGDFCKIFDKKRSLIFKIRMKNRSFPIQWQDMAMKAEVKKKNIVREKKQPKTPQSRPNQERSSRPNIHKDAMNKKKAEQRLPKNDADKTLFKKEAARARPSPRHFQDRDVNYYEIARSIINAH